MKSRKRTGGLQAPGRGLGEGTGWGGQASRLQWPGVAGLRGRRAGRARAVGLLEVPQHLQKLGQRVLGGWRQRHNEGRAVRARAPGGCGPIHSTPKQSSGHCGSPAGRDLPSPGPVRAEPASVPALSSRRFSLQGGQSSWSPCQAAGPHVGLLSGRDSGREELTPSTWGEVTGAQVVVPWPPATCRPPASSGLPTSAVAGRRKALWKPSSNHITPVSEDPGEKGLKVPRINWP